MMKLAAIVAALYQLESGAGREIVSLPHALAKWKASQADRPRFGKHGQPVHEPVGYPPALDDYTTRGRAMATASERWDLVRHVRVALDERCADELVKRLGLKRRAKS